MTQEEISAALKALPASDPPSGDWKDEQYRDERRRQIEISNQACEDLCRRLYQEDSRVVFNVLFPVSCTYTYRGALCANLLLYMKTPCPLPCKEVIREVSRSGWDASLEEVPWYVAVCFGTDAIYQSLDQLEAEDDIQEFREVAAAWHTLNSGPMSLSKYLETEKERPCHSVESRLGTIRYWTDILVNDREGILENWHPFWWRSKKSDSMR